MANVWQQTTCPVCKVVIAENDEWTLTLWQDTPELLFHTKCYNIVKEHQDTKDTESCTGKSTP